MSIKRSFSYNIIPYVIFLLSVILWDLTLVAVPYFEYLSGKYEIISSIIFINFHLLCHQMPERSYFIFGNQMPVCVRCTGIYFGFLIGTIIYPFIRGLKTREIPHRWILILALLPLGIDGFTQLIGLRESTNDLRIITGMFFGMLTAFFIMPAFLQIYDELYIFIKKQQKTVKKSIK